MLDPCKCAKIGYSPRVDELLDRLGGDLTIEDFAALARACLDQAGVPTAVQPSDIDQIAAWFETQAVKERELLDSGYCSNPVTAIERWLVYKASAQSVRERAWKKP